MIALVQAVSARLLSIDDKPSPTYQVSFTAGAATPGSIVTHSSRVLPHEHSARNRLRPAATGLRNSGVTPSFTPSTWIVE
jgi:hypothetical protein